MLLLAAMAHAACPADVASLESALDGAQAAFSLMDRAAFATAVEEVVRDVDCLSAPVTPALAARVHRVVGLHEFVSGRDTAARDAFAGARAIDPNYTFPEAVVPVDHPVRRLYNDASFVVDDRTPLPRPADGRLELDGIGSEQRPTARASLVLHIGADGSVRASRYLWPGDPLFPYTVASDVAVSSVEERTRKGPNVPLAIGAGASALAAGASWLVARNTETRFWDPATGEDELEPLQGRANALSIASVGLGVVAVGAGAGAVIAGRW